MSINRYCNYFPQARVPFTREGRIAGDVDGNAKRVLLLLIRRIPPPVEHGRQSQLPLTCCWVVPSAFSGCVRMTHCTVIGKSFFNTNKHYFTIDTTTVVVS